MSQNTSIVLEQHFTHFIDAQIQEGRYDNPTDVVRAGLKLLAEHEAKVNLLRKSLQDGLESGEPRPFDSEVFLSRMRSRYE